MKNLLLLSAFSILLVIACVKPPEYPVVPEIQFLNVSKSAIQQNADTTNITFSFTDGDGDIGLADNNPNTNVTLTDTRTGFQEFFKIPFIPQQGVASGISGEVTLTVLATCCLNSNPICQPTPGANPEEIIYTIQVRDEAGNDSNLIEVSPIMLICD